MNFGGPIDLTPFGGLLRGIGFLYWVVALGAAGFALWLPKRWAVKLPLAALVLAGFIYPIATRVSETKQVSEAARSRRDESMALFKERCKTAGEKISRTVEKVEGVVWMKWRDASINRDDQFNLDDPFGRDCGGKDCIAELLHATQGLILDPEATDAAARHKGPYRFVESIDPKDGARYRYTAAIRVIKQRTPEQIEQYKRNAGRDPGPDIYDFVVEKVAIDKFSARYGVTWDDISTREDREHWIAGGSSKVIDLQTNEVIGERVGYLIDRGQGSSVGGRTPWTWARSYGPTCPEPQRYRDFIAKVLRPN